MAFDTLTGNEKIKLQQFMDDGIAILTEIQDRRESLKDLAKTLADEFGVKPGILTKALSVAMKGSAEDESDAVDTVRAILVATGRA